MPINIKIHSTVYGREMNMSVFVDIILDSYKYANYCIEKYSDIYHFRYIGRNSRQRVDMPLFKTKLR